MARTDDILSFWLGTLGRGGVPVDNRTKLWFHSNTNIDELIREDFDTDLRKAAENQLTDWAQTPRGRLALIVLLDQFSRNIYRGTAKAFAHDEQALSLCLAGIDAGNDLALAPIERAFLYLPLEHAEDLFMQDKSVALMKALLQSVTTATQPKLQSFLDHALGHRDIIARFGRFPHRNKVLARRSTPEELAFLETDGVRFGQG